MERLAGSIGVPSLPASTPRQPSPRDDAARVLRGMRTQTGLFLKPLPPRMAQSAGAVIAAAEQAAAASVDNDARLLMTRSDAHALVEAAAGVDVGPRRRLFISRRDHDDDDEDEEEEEFNEEEEEEELNEEEYGEGEEDVYFIAETTKKRLKEKRLRYLGHESLEYSTWRTGYSRGAEMRANLNWNVDRQRYAIHIPRAKIMVSWLILLVLAIVIAAVFFTMALSSENIYSRAAAARLVVAVDVEMDGGDGNLSRDEAHTAYINGLLALFPVFVALNMTLACLSALLVVYLSPGAAGSGLPEMRAYLNGVRMRSALSWNTLVAKVLGTVLALSSGLFVGKEGPLAQIGCIVAACFGKRPRADARARRARRRRMRPHGGVARREGRRGRWAEEGWAGFDPPPAEDDEDDDEAYKDEDSGREATAAQRRRRRKQQEEEMEKEMEASHSSLERLLWPFRTNVERRDLATAGAAAGIAVAFNAPIGGIMFAFEEMATWWRIELTWKAFFCCAVGVIALRMLNGTCASEKRCGYYSPSREFALWSVNFDNNSDMLPDTGGIAKVLFDRIPVVVIGATGGVLGAILVSVNSRLLGLRERVFGTSKGWRQILDVVVISLASSATLFWLPFFFGRCQSNPSPHHHDHDISDGGATRIVVGGDDDGGRSSTYELFVRYNCPAGEYNDLALLMTGTQTNSIKLLFSSPSKSTRTICPMSLVVFAGQALALVAVTNGSSIPSGIFTPCIVIGAAMGRVLGIGLRALHFNDVDPAVCALLGSAAFVSGVMRRTVSLGVVLIEVANATMVVPNLMLAMLIAKSIADRVNASITDEHMRIKEIPFLAPQPAAITRGLQLIASDVMAKKPVSVNVVERVGRLVEVLRSCQHSAFPVVDDEADDFFGTGGGVGPDPGPGGGGLKYEGVITRECVVAALKSGRFLTEKLGRHSDRGGRLRPRTREEETARQLHRREKFAQSSRVRKVVVTKEDQLEDEAASLRKAAHRRELFVDLSDFVLPNPVVSEETPLEMTYELFRSMALRHLPVVRSFKEVVGMVSRVDLLSIEEPVVRRLEELSNATRQEDDTAAAGARERARRSIPPRLADFVSEYGNDDDVEAPLLRTTPRPATTPPARLRRSV